MTSSLAEREMPSQSSVSAGDKDIHQSGHFCTHESTEEEEEGRGRGGEEKERKEGRGGNGGEKGG